MEHKYVTIEKKGEIGFLILNRPQVNNALNSELITEIAQTLEELNRDHEVRLIIVKGAGRHFCAGVDLKQVISLDAAGCRRFFLSLNETFKVMHRIDKLVIAMVHGYATAGGMGLVASSDLVVASEDAHFGMAEVNVGMFGMGSSAVLLRQIASRRKTLEIGLTGDTIDAKEAERLGIVNLVVPGERLEAAIMELAQKILRKNPLAITMGKRNFYACADMEYEKAMDHSAEMLSTLANTKGAKEGIKAFLEKREPRW